MYKNTILIKTKEQGEFYRIEAENSPCSQQTNPPDYL